MPMFRSYHNPLPQEQSWMWNRLTSTWICSLTFSMKLAAILGLKGNPSRRTIVLFFGSRKRCKRTQLIPYSRLQWLNSAEPLHQDFQWLARKGIQKNGSTELLLKWDNSLIYNLSNLPPVSVSIIISLQICQDTFHLFVFKDCFVHMSSQSLSLSITINICLK